MSTSHYTVIFSNLESGKNFEEIQLYLFKRGKGTGSWSLELVPHSLSYIINLVQYLIFKVKKPMPEIKINHS